jgi:DNA-binding CsgD family transcriptional regulator
MLAIVQRSKASCVGPITIIFEWSMFNDERDNSATHPLQITPEERHALQLLADGKTSSDLAAGFGVSLVEAETLLTGLYAILGVASSARAVAAAHKRGLLTAEPLQGDSIHPTRFTRS